MLQGHLILHNRQYCHEIKCFERRRLIDDRTMKHVENIGVGGVIVAQGEIALRAIALGSCIGVAAYDADKRIGGMAHVMLPGSAPDKAVEKTRYAANAIEEMIRQMIERGSKPGNIEVCLVGGGNVLEREDDTICESIIESVREILENKGIGVKASAIGGAQRRSVSIDLESGQVWYTEGDREKRLLWTWSETSQYQSQCRREAEGLRNGRK